jgi:hypothetical protein
MWEFKRLLCIFSVLLAFTNGKGMMSKDVSIEVKGRLVSEHIIPEKEHFVKTESHSEVKSGSSFSYSYKSESSYSYSYSYSSFSSASSSAYYYAYGYSASG